MTNIEIQARLLEAELYFLKSHSKIVREAERLYFSKTVGARTKLESLLITLPTKENMLKELVEKLKGKPVYSTLKKIMEGKANNSHTTLKGLFSLGTHVAIECEQGNDQYRILLPFIFEKIGNIL